MESTTLKGDNLKPVMLKAGVPLAVSVAGVIYAWIVAKRRLSSKASSLLENEANLNPTETNSRQGIQIEHEGSFHSLSSVEDEESSTTPMDNTSVLSGNSVIHENPCLEQEITGLRSRIEGLQMRELALRLQFDQYCDLKEQESQFTEIRNVLSLETARVEFLDREISSTAKENMRLENFVVQYLRVIEQLECWKSENRLLQRKVKKLLGKSKAQSRLIKEQTSKIKADEAEILRNSDALQTRTSVINKLENEIRELQGVLDQLQDEKNELLKKLDTAEKSYASKIEAGDARKEDYKKVLNELEQVKREREAEAEELIHFRWTNACLRHELMRHHEQQQQQQQDHGRDHEELEFEGGGGDIHYDSEEHELHCDSLLEHHNVRCIASSAHTDHAYSKRGRFLRRLKRWVEGSEKIRMKPEEKDRHEIKCIGRHSVSHETKEPQVPARRSCSSA